MTLAVEVRLLTGRYVATRFNTRDEIEWPPHPARLYFSAVAAWADGGAGDDERRCLQWWEQMAPPSITCSWGAGSWSERSRVTHYVPDNDVRGVLSRDLSGIYSSLLESDSWDLADTRLRRQRERLQTKAVTDSAKAATSGAAPAGAVGVLPERRGRQARTYPTVIPDDDRVVYAWEEGDASSSEAEVLDRVLARVSRLGHSSSMVSVRVVAAAPSPTLVPSAGGSLVLRVTADGQLASLESQYHSHQGVEPRTLATGFQAYAPARQASEPTPSSVWAERWSLLELDAVGDGQSRPRYAIQATLPIARAVRASLMRWSADPPSELISGHPPGGTGPTERPHLAVVPLPFVGHPHATGLVQGVALLLPAGADPGDLGDAVGRWLRPGDECGDGRLVLGERGAARVRLVDTARASLSCRPFRWVGPARRWVSVTPVALDRNPGQLGDRDPSRRDRAVAAAEETVARACEAIGLPAPSTVTVTAGPLVAGSLPAKRFPSYATRGGRLQRVLVHVAVEFPVPVRGPVLLGAGRYLGYGLCYPLDARVEDDR